MKPNLSRIVARCAYNLVRTNDPVLRVRRSQVRCISKSASILGDAASSQQGTIDPTVNDNTADAGLVNPLDYEDYFNLRSMVRTQGLFLNQCHFGHHEKCRNEYMTPYLFGTRSNTDIIDLEKTVPLFQDALNIIAHIAYRGGIILFISRQKMTMPLVETTAKNCGEFAHCRYWNPGLFTDRVRVFSYPTRLPDLCIFLHTQNSVFQTHRAVSDAAKMLIPTVGIVDSNCDPRLITYPIPGNDDTMTSVMYYLTMFERAIKAGKRRREIDLKME